MKQVTAQQRKTGRPLSFDRDGALRQAMLMFWRHGYESTSINDLTRAMGVTAPSFYTAYGDKKGLFLESMQLYAGTREDFDRLLNTARSAREAAHNLLTVAAKSFTGSSSPRGCLLASATASGSTSSSDVQMAVSNVRHWMTNSIRIRIEKDIAAGVLPGYADASALATMVIALIQGMSVLSRDGKSRRTLDAMIETAMTAWPKNN